jgi:hypothetical protein
VIADGIGLADRHAPNPAVARGTSRRDAEDAARKVLGGKLGELPLASGGTVASRAKSDKAIKERLDRAVAAAILLTADPETDGAWRVTMAVPIEAVRLALIGPRVATEDKGPQVIVVEGVSAKPAVGWEVGKPGASLAAPTLWVADVPTWAQTAPRVKATSAKGGVIDADQSGGTVATLYVIVSKP